MSTLSIAVVIVVVTVLAWTAAVVATLIDPRQATLVGLVTPVVMCALGFFFALIMRSWKNGNGRA